MEKNYRYDAFLSYRHLEHDKAIAAKLQKMLEEYKPPKSLSKDFSKWRVFRDETELSTGASLSDGIKEALESSRFLIVVCSEKTKDSKWCMEEITHFKELHNGSNENIICLVVSGDPVAVFPTELTYEKVEHIDENGIATFEVRNVEPLAANVSGKTVGESKKKLKNEFLRIAAPLLGCSYDALYNRNQKRHIKRLLTVAGLVVAFLLMFTIYTSAMLLEINTQKTALQKANEELRTKTEELEKSNSNLELKTNEAQANLVEAEKQKQEAEKNLAEAEKQRKKAEENLAEAKRQEQIAKDNADEAQRQKNVAEENMLIAQTNEAEANRQQQIAKENADEAQRQKNVAEENMLIAQANEAKANEANKNVMKKNSEILANQAKIYLDDGDYQMALKTAIESVQPDIDLPVNNVAKYVMATVTGAYGSVDGQNKTKVKLSGYVESVDYSQNGDRLFASDASGTVYVIDSEKSKIIKSHSPMELFDSTSKYITSVKVMGNDALVLYSGVLVSINLEKGDINWKVETETSAQDIVANEKSNYIFLPGYTTYAILDKSGNLIKEVEYKEDPDYSYSYNGMVYMDEDGKIYNVQPEKGMIQTLSTEENQCYPLGVGTSDDIIAVDANDTCLFVNVKLKDEEDTPKMMCLDKTDMSLKWETKYETESFINESYCNVMFDYFAATEMQDGSYKYDDAWLAVVGGVKLVVFDKETGKIIFEDDFEYDNRVVYCKPSDNRKYLKMAREELFSTFSYFKLGEAEDNLIITDYWKIDGGIDGFAYKDDDSYAVLQSNSPEIKLYLGAFERDVDIMSGIPENIGYLDFTTDNGNGIVVMCSYNYNDDIKENYVTVFDIVNKKLCASCKVPIDTDMAIAVGEKIMLLDGKGNAIVIDIYGNILEEFNLIHKLSEACGENFVDRYFSIFSLGFKCYENKAYINNNLGAFILDFGGVKVNFSAFCDDFEGYDYRLSKNRATFIVRDYKTNVEKIAYAERNGETKYVSENGQASEFAQNTNSSLTVSGDGNLIAFINKSGYIGVYNVESGELKKIFFKTGETDPINIIISPNGENLIVLCSNGTYIRYSIDTCEKACEYIADFTVYSIDEICFIDDKVLLIEGDTMSERIMLDVESMQEIAKVSNFVYYMKNNRSFVRKEYIDSKNYYTNYPVLSDEELVLRAKEMVDKYN